MSVNKAIIMGRLGKTPEAKHTSSGTLVCEFSVATSERFVNKNGQKQEKTEWHNIVGWGKTAEVLSRCFVKGNQIYIEGKIQTQTWEKNGEKKYKTVIIVQEFQFVDGKNSSSGVDQSASFGSEPVQENEDLPF